MKVTIVTVVYNRKDTIEQTIWSVISQTYKNIEFIIIDGGSNDGTVDIIKKYSDKIDYWISEKDTGIYNAMNKGILRATGDYIQFLNADDSLVDETIIETVVAKIENNNMPDIFSTAIWLVDEKMNLQYLLRTSDIRHVRKGAVIPHPGVYMKSHILKEYMFNEKYSIVSDFELILKCALSNKIFYFENYPTVFFSNGGISSTNESIRVKEHYDVLTKYFDSTIAEKFIETHKGRHIKKFLEYVCNFCGILQYLRRVKGWKEHRCNNRYCRWCKKISSKL